MALCRGVLVVKPDARGLNEPTARPWPFSFGTSFAESRFPLSCSFFFFFFNYRYFFFPAQVMEVCTHCFFFPAQLMGLCIRLELMEVFTQSGLLDKKPCS